MERDVGFYEIHVWGEDGTMYAVPSLIFHYILEYGYQPPQEFIDAVIGSADASSDSYYQKVLEYSNGYDFWLAKNRTKRKKKNDKDTLAQKRCKAFDMIPLK